jgi:hypothetical protein
LRRAAVVVWRGVTGPVLFAEKTNPWMAGPHKVGSVVQLFRMR